MADTRFRRRVATTPDQRVATRLADMERRSGAAQRQQTSGSPWFPVQTCGAIVDSTIGANTAYYMLLNVPYPVTLTGIANFNGTVINGSMEVALFDSSGAVIVVSASTVQAGASTWQKIPFTTPLQAQAGTYYGLVMSSSATARMFVAAGAATAPSASALQGGFIVPSTITVPTLPKTAPNASFPIFTTY